MASDDDTWGRQNNKGQNQQYDDGNGRGDGQQQFDPQGRGQQNSGQQRQTQRGSVPLLDGEEVILDARPAWSAYFKLLLLAGLFFVGSAIALDGSAGLILGLVGAGIIVGYVYYLRKRRRYVVTDRRIMILTGISSKATNEAWMVDIIGLQTGSTFLERLLGHGHVKATRQIGNTGYGFFGGLTFGGIKNYEEVAQIIRQQQNQHKTRASR